MGATELAIIVTGTVGLGAPALSAGFQVMRDRTIATRVRFDKDLEELRALLDETTATMYTHTTNLVVLEAWMQRSSFGMPTAKKPPSMADTRGALSNQRARLVIRRGRQDKLVKTFIAYLKPADDSLAEIDALWPQHEPFDYSDEQLAERAEGYWHAYEVFVDTCQEEVGSRIQR